MKFLIYLAATLALAVARRPEVWEMNRSGRIVGGEDATDNAAPFIVSLQLLNSHTCGASIVSGLWAFEFSIKKVFVLH